MKAQNWILNNFWRTESICSILFFKYKIINTNLQLNPFSYKYFSDCMILSSWNDDVDDLNNIMLNAFSEQEQTFFQYLQHYLPFGFMNTNSELSFFLMLYPKCLLIRFGKPMLPRLTVLLQMRQIAQERSAATIIWPFVSAQCFQILHFGSL